MQLTQVEQMEWTFQDQQSWHQHLVYLVPLYCPHCPMKVAMSCHKHRHFARWQILECKLSRASKCQSYQSCLWEEIWHKQRYESTVDKFKSRTSCLCWDFGLELVISLLLSSTFSWLLAQPQCCPPQNVGIWKYYHIIMHDTMFLDQHACGRWPLWNGLMRWHICGRFVIPMLMALDALSL